MLEPFRVHVERRPEIEEVWIAAGLRRLLEVRDAGLRAAIRTAHVHAEHQVEPFHRRLERAGERDRTRVVDQDVDAAEVLRAALRRLRDFGVVADVHRHRQGSPARGFDLFGGGVDRARQFRIRLRGLGDDRDVRAIARSAQRDRLPDAARRAGDEQRLAGKAHSTPDWSTLSVELREIRLSHTDMYTKLSINELGTQPAITHRSELLQ
jgi:hypothetical protein